MGKTTARAAIYVRKSTEDAKNKGKSLRDQIRVCADEADRRGLTVVATFEDEGKSASRFARKGTTRSGYEDLLDLVHSKGVDYILFAEQSRGSRRLSEIGRLHEACAEIGVKWIVGGREIDHAEPGDIVLTSVQGGMDAAESARLSKRALRGAEGSALAGRPAAKNVFGYRRLYDPITAALSSVEIVPEEREVIREIVDRCLAGESLYVIANGLNDDGVPVPSDWVSVRQGRTPKGGKWIGTQVKRIAVSPAYAGFRVHHGEVITEGMWPAIVTASEHRRLKALLESPERRRREVNPGALKHWLSGLAVCGECGSRVRYGVNRGKYASYICANVRCLKTSRAAEPLEAMVRDAVIALAARPAIRKAVASTSDDSAQARRAWGEVEALQERLSEVEAGILDGSMPVAVGGRVASQLETELAAARKAATAVSMPSLPIGVDLSTLGETFDDLEPAQKRAIATAFVEVSILKAPRSSKFNPEFVKITAKGAVEAGATRKKSK